MATEYVYLGTQNVSASNLIEFVAKATGGNIINDNFVEYDGIQVTPRRENPAEKTYITDAFGFIPRIRITFRFANAGRDAEERNVVIMVQLVLRLWDRYGGAGVLLFNGEEAVLQKLNDVVALDIGWEEIADISALHELVKDTEIQRLHQPLL